MSQSPIQRIRTAWRRLPSDRKKTIVMSLLVTTALLLWGRLLLKHVPQTTVADPNDGFAAVSSSDRRHVKDQMVWLEPNAELTRNLFEFDPNPYRRTPPREIEDDDRELGTDSPDEQQRLERLQQDARAINLQSIVSGPPPVAMIDGQVLRVGDTIEGFEIVRINPTQWTVDLKRDGHVIRIRR